MHETEDLQGEHICASCGRRAHARGRRTLDERIADTAHMPHPLAPLRDGDEVIALAEFHQARDVYDQAVEQLFRRYDRLFPTYFRSAILQPDYLNARGRLELAEIALQEAQRRFNKLERARIERDRVAAATEKRRLEQETAERRELERIRARAGQGVGSRLRRLLGGEA